MMKRLFILAEELSTNSLWGLLDLDMKFTVNKHYTRVQWITYFECHSMDMVG